MRRFTNLQRSFLDFIGIIGIKAGNTPLKGGISINRKRGASNGIVISLISSHERQ